MRVDIAVVGGGIAGISVAGELSRGGARVAVLEQEDRLAYHASGRSAATFLESYGSPTIRALTRASRAALEHTEPDEAPLLVPRRLLWVGGAGLESTVEKLVAAEPLLRRIDEDEARRYCPGLRPGWLGAAASEDGAQDLDVAGLFDRYRRLALRSGTTVLTSAPLRGAHRRAGRWHLTTDTGEIEAATLVNAAGAWADRVAELAGAAPVGVRPLRRTVAVVTTPVPTRDWPLVSEVSDQFYFRPEGDGLLISPADETPSEPVDARASTEDVALAVERVNEASTLDIRHVRTTWAGLRTFSPDRNPVVGYDVAQDGFFWLAGQGGYGMQTAPAMARLAAALVRGEAVPDDLLAQGLDHTRLAPQRFRTPVAA